MILSKSRRGTDRNMKEIQFDLHLYIKIQFRLLQLQTISDKSIFVLLRDMSNSIFPNGGGYLLFRKRICAQRLIKA